MITLNKIIKSINIKQQLSKNIDIKNINDIRYAKNHEITFFNNSKYIKYLINCKAAAVLLEKKFAKLVPSKVIPIISKFPDLDFIKVTNLFYPESYYCKISYKNLNDDEIKKKYVNLSFGRNFYLEDNVKIGRKVFIGNNVTIKKNCIIGDNVVIGSNVLLEEAVIGNNVHICDGAIIGKKGFGFKFIKKKILRIPHVGKVFIEDNCEIGSNCVIDRGSVSNTIIKESTFLDNLVHIAHNVLIGKNCILAAQVGIAGSTTIGNNVIIGGQAGVSGHLIIGNNVKIGGKSGVLKNIPDNQVVMGYPAKSIREFVKG